MPEPGLLLMPTPRMTNADVKYHQQYHTVCRVFAADPSPDETSNTSYTQRFLVYGADVNSRPLVKRVATLLLILWNQEIKRFHHDHNSDKLSIQVWLCQTKAAGLLPDTAGEQFQSQIYIYDVDRERRPIEWVREISHEYGHYALPGISGFKEPEEWANGVLGERLFLKWIYEDLISGKVNAAVMPFVTEVDLLDFMNKQVWPLISRVSSVGISSAALARRDMQGMDNYTALALYIDQFYGSSQLLRSMSYTAPAKQDVFTEAPDFYRGFVQSLKVGGRFQIRLKFNNTVPPMATHTFYLTKGSYLVDFSGGPTVWHLATADNKQVKSVGTTVMILTDGWYSVRFNSPPKVNDLFTVSSTGKEKEKE